MTQCLSETQSHYSLGRNRFTEGQSIKSSFWLLLKNPHVVTAAHKTHPFFLPWELVQNFFRMTHMFVLLLADWYKACQGLFAFGIVTLLVAFLVACINLCSGCCREAYTIVQSIGGLLIFACEYSSSSQTCVAAHFVWCGQDWAP